MRGSKQQICGSHAETNRNAEVLISSMKSSFWVLTNDGRLPVPICDCEDVCLVLTSAAGDPAIVQQLRLGLERSTPGNVRTFRLNDREVISQVFDLVVRGDVVLAPASPVKPAAENFKTYKENKLTIPSGSPGVSGWRCGPFQRIKRATRWVTYSKAAEEMATSRKAIKSLLRRGRSSLGSSLRSEYRRRFDVAV